MFRLKWILALIALLFSAPAWAVATNTAIVVAACDNAGIFGPVNRDAPLTVTTAGLLCTSSGGGSSGGTSSTFGAAFPATGTASGFSDGTNMQGARVYDTDLGAGTEYTIGAQIRAAASGGSVAIGGDAANGLDVDVTRVTGTVTIAGAVTQGTSPWIVAGGGTAGSAATGVVTIQGIASGTAVIVSDGSGAMNVIVDSGTLTAVTSITNAVTVAQATAASLNATVVGTGTFVVQENGAALTALQLIDNAVGPVTAGSATATGSLITSSQYNSTLPTFTNGQQGPFQIGTRGSQNVTLFSENTNVSASYGRTDLDTLGTSGTTNVLMANSVIRLFNGTNFSRAYEAVHGMNTTGTGVAAAGNLAEFDDTSPTSITENSFGTLRISANRNLYGTIRDAAGNERGTNVDSSNRLTANIATAADSIAKNEDAVAATADTGVPALAVQQAAPQDDAADGDYAHTKVSGGFAWVSARPTVTTISATITRPSDTNAYAANDAFANSTTVPTSGGFTFTSACRASGGYGTITDAIISASASTAYQGEIWVFDQSVTAINDNAAFTITDGEAQTIVGVIPFSTSDTTSANSISYINGLNIGYTCSGTANLRFLVKIMAAVTPASAEVLAVRIKVQN